MTTEIDSPDIQGCYLIDKGDDSKWYVIRISNAWVKGGQCAVEYEHPHGFSTKASAKRWVERDIEKVLDYLLAAEADMEGTI